MSDRFQIYKDDDGYHLPWNLDYPDGFDDADGEAFESFTEAVAAFVEASERQCPSCLRGAVVDTDWGWDCANCGSYDVAAGCTTPIDSHGFLPVAGHPDDDECTHRSDGTDATYCGEPRNRHTA